MHYYEAPSTKVWKKLEKAKGNKIEGKNQAELAKLLDIPPTTLSDWLKGKSKPPWLKLEKGKIIASLEESIKED